MGPFFLTLYPCDLIGSRRRLLGDFVTGYFNGTRARAKHLLCQVIWAAVFQGAAPSTRCFLFGCNDRTEKRRPWASDQRVEREVCLVIRQAGRAGQAGDPPRLAGAQC